MNNSMDSVCEISDVTHNEPFVWALRPVGALVIGGSLQMAPDLIRDLSPLRTVARGLPLLCEGPNRLSIEPDSLIGWDVI